MRNRKLIIYLARRVDLTGGNVDKSLYFVFECSSGANSGNVDDVLFVDLTVIKLAFSLKLCTNIIIICIL